jgi:hypothetical protein
MLGIAGPRLASNPIGVVAWPLSRCAALCRCETETLAASGPAIKSRTSPPTPERREDGM